jgi:CubicO group peptidase (beta-lactamase class C family)
MLSLKSSKLSLKVLLVASLAQASLCLAATLPAISQEHTTPSDARLISALKSFIPFVMQQGGPPGVNLAVYRHGEVIWEGAFGYADLSTKAPMTPQTVFHSGSIGKTFTATAVMQLVEQGVIGLDDPINKYLKQFKITNPLGDREITFRDLLTHRSGLTSNAAGSEFALPEPLETHIKNGYARKMFESYDEKYLPLWTTKVGQTFQYSNFGLATLGYLVEVTNPEGLTFSQYVQKHIMDPLDMKSSMYPPVQDFAHVRPEIFARFSTGYADFGPISIPTPTVYFADYPAGTVVGTPGDLIRLAAAYLNKGSFHGYRLLKPETVQLMLSQQIDFGGGNALGLIWQLRNVGKPGSTFGHGGLHMFGWTNDLRAFPEQDLGVAIATNEWDMVHYGDASFRSGIALIEAFIGSWLEGEKKDIHTKQPERSWSWKTSYIIGLITVERLKGGLGIRTPISPDMVESMIRGAHVRNLGSDAVNPWDPAGFRAGINDMLKVEMTPDGIRAFMQSDQLQVAPEELEILYRELGGHGVFLPWPEFVPPVTK